MLVLNQGLLIVGQQNGEARRLMKLSPLLQQMDIISHVYHTGKGSKMQKKTIRAIGNASWAA